MVDTKKTKRFIWTILFLNIIISGITLFNYVRFIIDSPNNYKFVTYNVEKANICISVENIDETYCRMYFHSKSDTLATDVLELVYPADCEVCCGMMYLKLNHPDTIYIDQAFEIKVISSDKYIFRKISYYDIDETLGEDEIWLLHLREYRSGLRISKTPCIYRDWNNNKKNCEFKKIPFYADKSKKNKRDFHLF